MALASTHISIVHDSEAGATVADWFNKPSSDVKQGLQALSTFMDGALGGVRNCSVRLRVETGATSDDFANGTVVITHANVTAGDTLTIAGNLFTWQVAAANENEITIGTTATTDGDALVAALAAHSVIASFVSGVNVTGTVTISSKLPGYLGKLMTYATSDATAFALTQPTLTNPTLSVATRIWSQGA